MPARTGAGRRRKGRAFELKIIKDLWEGHPPWKPNESPDSGFRAPPPFDQWHLEMKNQESLNIWAALKQAAMQVISPGCSMCDYGRITANCPFCGEASKYAVIFTRSRHEIYVAIPYEEWKRLVKK